MEGKRKGGGGGGGGKRRGKAKKCIEKTHHLTKM